MLPSLIPILGAFTTGAVVSIERREPDTYGADGVLVPGALTSIPLTGAVHMPAGPRELQRLPEGRRSRESRTVFSPVVLLSADEVTGRNADHVTIDGRAFEVAAVENWIPLGGVCRAIVQKVEG